MYTSDRIFEELSQVCVAHPLIESLEARWDEVLHHVYQSFPLDVTADVQIPEEWYLDARQWARQLRRCTEFSVAGPADGDDGIAFLEDCLRAFCGYMAQQIELAEEQDWERRKLTTGGEIVIRPADAPVDPGFVALPRLTEQLMPELLDRFDRINDGQADSGAPAEEPSKPKREQSSMSKREKEDAVIRSIARQVEFDPLTGSSNRLLPVPNSREIERDTIANGEKVAFQTVENIVKRLAVSFGNLKCDRNRLDFFLVWGFQRPPQKPGHLEPTFDEWLSEVSQLSSGNWDSTEENFVSDLTGMSV